MVAKHSLAWSSESDMLVGRAADVDTCRRHVPADHRTTRSAASKSRVSRLVAICPRRCAGPTLIESGAVLEWTAYPPAQAAGDFTTAGIAEIRSLFDVSVIGLAAAVQAILPDLKKAKDPALLVTNGGAGYVDPAMDAMLT